MPFTPLSPASTTASRTRRTGSRVVAIVIAFAAFCAVAAVWFWISLQAVPVALFGWQNGVLVGGGGLFCLSVLAAIGGGFDDVLDWIWVVISAIAAVIVGIFWGILALFGWD